MIQGNVKLFNFNDKTLNKNILDIKKCRLASRSLKIEKTLF